MCSFLFFSWLVEAKKILSLTGKHALRLGSFAALYGVVRAATACLLPASLVPCVSGAIAASCIFSERDAVNLQLVLYIFSRVAYALLRKHAPALPFRFLSAAVWAAVMQVFEQDSSSLLPSLRKSMKFIYADSGCIPNTAAVGLSN